jgi:hypothetical protein
LTGMGLLERLTGVKGLYAKQDVAIKNDNNVK